MIWAAKIKTSPAGWLWPERASEEEPEEPGGGEPSGYVWASTITPEGSVLHCKVAEMFDPPSAKVNHIRGKHLVYGNVIWPANQRAEEMLSHGVWWMMLPAESAAPGPPPAQTCSPVNPAELTPVDGSCSPLYLQNLQLVLRSFRLPTLDLRNLESTPTRAYRAVVIMALLNSQNIVTTHHWSPDRWRGDLQRRHTWVRLCDLWPEFDLDLCSSAASVKVEPRVSSLLPVLAALFPGLNNSQLIWIKTWAHMWTIKLFTKSTTWWRATHLNLSLPRPPPPPPPRWSSARRPFLWEEEGDGEEDRMSGMNRTCVSRGWRSRSSRSSYRSHQGSVAFIKSGSEVRRRQAQLGFQPPFLFHLKGFYIFIRVLSPFVSVSSFLCYFFHDVNCL